jgi:hypothetical protein
MAEDLSGYSWGLEWDFLAVDSGGHVAAVSAGPYGPVPDPVRAAGESAEYEASAIAALPTVTQAIPADPSLVGNFSYWLSMSERGLFAYDWLGTSGPYTLIAAPVDPLDVSSLPADIQTAARVLQLPYPFAGARQLDLS